MTEFLESGVPLVWVVDPAERTVTVYRSLSHTERYTADDTITAEPILPGFSCMASDFFDQRGCVEGNGLFCLAAMDTSWIA